MFEWWDWRYLCAGAGVDDESDELTDDDPSSSRPAATPAMPRIAPIRRQGSAKDEGRRQLARRQGTVQFHKDNILEAARSRVEEQMQELDFLLHPEDVQRRCTDVPWLISYLLLLAALLAVCLWQPKETALLRLSDYKGGVCGVADLMSTPFAYVCPVNNGTLQTAFTVCRASCPRHNRTKHRCSNQMTGVEAEVEDYPTETLPMFLSNLCVPQQMELMNHLFVYHAREAEEVRIYVVLKRMRIPLLVAGLVALCIAYCYLSLLKDYALAISTVGIRLIVVVPWLWAMVLYWQNGEDALMACAALICVGAILACLACAHLTELTKAAACIQLSCKCVLATPLLSLGPPVVLATRLCVTALMVECLLVSPAGIYYNHQHTELAFSCTQETCPANLVLFLCWLGMFLWIDSTITASWEFSISYLASAWYIVGGVQEELSLQGVERQRQILNTLRLLLWALFRYHIGTMVKAAMIIGFLRPFRFFLGTLTAAARMEENLLGSCISVCCGCVVDVYEQHFEKFSANAYIEVALSSEPLWSAAKKATEISHLQVTAAGSLNGTTFIFQLICGAMVWWSGYFIVFLTVGGYVPGMQGYGNPYSGYYVGNPHLWSNVGGVVSVVVAFPYMMVFDTASDTILYCAMSDKVRKEKRSSGSRSFSDRFTDVLGWFSDALSWSGSDSSDELSSGSSSFHRR